MDEKFFERENLNSPEHEKSLDEIDLSGVADSIQKYNEQFSAGKVAGEILKASVDETGEITEKEKERNREGALAEIEQKYRQELGRTGLGLQSVKAILGGDLGASEMRINLLDEKKFINYLEALNQGVVSEPQEKGLIAVAESLADQLLQEYDVSNPKDERMISLVGNLEKIIDEYKKMDQKSANNAVASVEKLEQYLEAIRGKYLKEYLLAEKSGFLGNRVGPKDWHIDSSPDSYKKYWKEALKRVVEIGKNKNAYDFQRTVIENLQGFLTQAKKDLEPMFQEVLERQETDRNNPDVIILTEFTEEDVKKKIEEYKIIMDEVYEKLRKLEK